MEKDGAHVMGLEDLCTLMMLQNGQWENERHQLDWKRPVNERIDLSAGNAS